MKKTLKDLINTTKYKRKFNTYKLKYESTLEEKIKDKEKIEKLQDEIIVCLKDRLEAKDKIKKLKKELKENAGRK